MPKTETKEKLAFLKIELSRSCINEMFIEKDCRKVLQTSVIA